MFRGHSDTPKNARLSIVQICVILPKRSQHNHAFPVQYLYINAKRENLYPVHQRLKKNQIYLLIIVSRR